MRQIEKIEKCCVCLAVGRVANDAGRAPGEAAHSQEFLVFGAHSLKSFAPSHIIFEAMYK